MTDNSGAIQFDATTTSDRAEYEQQLQQAIQHLEALPASASEADKARVNLDIAEAKIGLGESETAWELARSAFDVFIAEESWQDAVEACEVMYQTAAPASVIALCHGIWLSVTYPVKPQTTVTMLNYLIEDTPDNSDGAAVAAATAHYIAGVRASDVEFESLSFLTRNLLVKVAERHSKIDSQQALDIWMQKLELTEPEVFLPRMGRVLEIIVIDQWWIDREALRAKLPVN